MVTKEEHIAPYKNLKVLIYKKGKTQAVIADELNMDRSTFNLKINRTKGRDFTFEEAIKLSKLLNENIGDFF